MIGILVEVLGGLGLGGQLATAAAIASGGWYLWRVGAIAGMIASVLSSARLIGISLAVVLAGAVALGWIDVSIGAFVDDVLSAASRLPAIVRDLLGVVSI